MDEAKVFTIRLNNDGAHHCILTGKWALKDFGDMVFAAIMQASANGIIDNDSITDGDIDDFCNRININITQALQIGSACRGKLVESKIADTIKDIAAAMQG